ncbi:MAG: protein kinase, partial [Bdellovibrionales bacterium]|nr:protein kinase [Bdellovibrionales bacterium]
QKASTAEGGLILEPAYVAPEQIDDSGVDARTDIYSLAVLLFEMTTGRRPFAEANPLLTAVARLSAPPPSLRELQPSLEEGFEAAVLKALAREPDERFTDALSFARAIGGEVSERRDPKTMLTSFAGLRLPGGVETIHVSVSTAGLGDLLDQREPEPDATTEQPRPVVPANAPRASRSFRVVASYAGAAVFGGLLVLFAMNSGVLRGATHRDTQEASPLATATQLPLADQLRNQLVEEAASFDERQRRRSFEAALIQAEALGELRQYVLPPGRNALEQIEAALQLQPGDSRVLALLYRFAALNVLEGDRARDKRQDKRMQEAYLTAQALGVDPKFIFARRRGEPLLNEGALPEGYLDRGRLVEVIAELSIRGS